MNSFFYFITLRYKIVWLQGFLFLFVQAPALCADNDTAHAVNKKNIKAFSLQEQLQVFYPVNNTAEYAVTVCIDVPVNNNPGCVFKKGEPGHVFLILSKLDVISGKIINRTFGFYPRVPVTCLFKRVRSQVMDNSNREYDASLEMKLTSETFAGILQKCMELAKKKYDLKKFNCYDYVLGVFNSIPGIEKLPLTKVKFPFIIGWGGSPCGLYGDLKKLLLNGSAWASSIKFGLFKSPAYDASKDLAFSY